jgi:hypothetical protein
VTPNIGEVLFSIMADAGIPWTSVAIWADALMANRAQAGITTRYLRAAGMRIPSIWIWSLYVQHQIE